MPAFVVMVDAQKLPSGGPRNWGTGFMEATFQGTRLRTGAEPIRNLRSFDLIFSFGGGTPGLKEWILFAGDPGNIPIAGGVTAVQAPLMYPYYPAQMLGMMGGIKGAAEYESELMKNYPRFGGDDYSRPGLEMMGPRRRASWRKQCFGRRTNQRCPRERLSATTRCWRRSAAVAWEWSTRRGR